MKGIILAGGHGTRLYPSTLSVSKQLMPVYDKPLLYYPLSTLMLAGIQDILVISSERDLPAIKTLLCDGSQFGLTLSYKAQYSPDGIPQAFILAEDFLNGDSVCLILGDNIYYGQGFSQCLREAGALCESIGGALVFGYHVQDPERYGVVSFNDKSEVTAIHEKPKNPASHYALTHQYGEGFE